MAIDPSRFKQTLARFASGVTVVTTAAGGRRAGLTVSAFSSLSLDPPLVLVAIAKGARGHDEIAAAGRFVVNVLRSDQEAVSNRFASRAEDRFEGIRFRDSAAGQPILDGCVAVLECDLSASLPGGDHTIYVGEVVASEVQEGEPLLYWNGGYRRLAG